MPQDLRSPDAKDASDRKKKPPPQDLRSPDAKDAPDRKKRPPVPVPSISAPYDPAYAAPLPKPKRKTKPTIVDRRPSKKPQPQKHLPLQTEAMPVETWAAQTLLGEEPSKEERRRINRYNQTKERERRAAARQARRQRAAEAARRRGLQEAARRGGAAAVQKTLGKNQSVDDYITNGRMDRKSTGQVLAEGAGRVAEAVGGAVVSRLADTQNWVIAPFLTGSQVKGDPMGEALGELMLGPNVMKAIAGQPYDPRMLGVELALLGIPVKGLPTSLSFAIRSLVGGRRFAAAIRRSETVSDLFRATAELNKPVMSVRAARRARLRATGAPRSSHWLAGALANRIEAGSPGRVRSAAATFVRNDPSTMRRFADGAAVEEKPAALSRTFKYIVHPIVDALRPGLSKLPGVKSEQAWHSVLLAKRTREQQLEYERALAALKSALPKGGDDIPWNDINWPGVYAVRAVLKGEDLPVIIRQLSKDAEAAAEAGEWLTEKTLKTHIAYYSAGAKYVAKNADGVQVLSPEAPAGLEILRRAIENSAALREATLEPLGLLAAEAATLRIMNEQLYYNGAKLKPLSKHITDSLEEHPVRAQLVRLANKNHPDDAEYIVTVQDAKARVYYDAMRDSLLEEAHYSEQMAGKTRNARERADWLARAARQREEARTLRPSVWYDNLSQISDELPPDIILEQSDDMGRFGKDWRFSILDMENPFTRTPAEAKTNLARALRATLPQPVNERILDEHGLPIVGSITYPEMVARILLVTPDAAQRAHDASFYHMLDDAFGELLADEEILAWLSSQKGASPSRGILDLLKVKDALTRGESNLQGIGYAVKEMEAILRSGGGAKLSKGAAAKISDFIDSALLKSTRTWLGDYMPTPAEIEQGAELFPPLVADRWGFRSVGMVDGEGAINLIKRRWGITVKSDVPITKPKSGKKPSAGLSPVQYEQVAKQYRGLVKYMNEIKFDGRDDWTGLEIQAMDWAAIQRYWGEKPEHLSDAIESQIRRIDFEVTQGPSGLGNALSPEEAERVAAAMLEDAVRLAKARSGVTVRRAWVDRSGWARGSNASVHMELFGLEHNVMPVITDVARGFDQGLVQASRWMTVNRGPYQSRAALIIASPALEDPEMKARFFAALAKEHPELDGFMPFRPDRPGIVIRTASGNLGPQNRERWIQKFMPAIERVEKEMGIETEVDGQNLQLLIGSQHGPASVTDTTESVGRVARLADLDRAQADVRRRLRAVIAEALRAREGGGTEPVDWARFSIVDPGDVAKGEDISSTFAAAAHAVGVRVPGWEEAQTLAAKGERPVEFVRDLIADTSLHHYDRLKVTARLDQLSGNELRNADWADVPGANRLFKPEGITLQGLYDPKTQSVYVSKYGNPMTYEHELSHAAMEQGLMTPDGRDAIWKFVGAEPRAEMTERQAEDAVDMIEAMILGIGTSKSKLPQPVKDAFVHFAQQMREGGGERAKAMLDKMPEELRMLLEDEYAFQTHAGVKIWAGALGFEPKPGTYVPEVPGLPWTWRDHALSPRRYAAQWNRLLANRRISNLTVTDQRLQHQFTASLIASGQWERDVTRGSMEAQMKAMEIQRMVDLRDGLVASSSPIPNDPSDVMVPLNPAAWTDEVKQQSRQIFRLFDQMEEGRPIGAQQLSRVEARAIEQAKGHLFPGLADGTEEKVAEIAQMVIDSQQPIDGVVWVSRDKLAEVGLLKRGFDALEYSPGSKAQFAIDSFDFVNNVAKMLTLSLNPAYYPMNMGGQLTMLFSQGAFFHPLTVARALMSMRQFTNEELALVDRFAGTASGLHSVVEGRGLGRGVTNAVAKVSEKVIDVGPRRVAFFIECRRLGYKTYAEVLDLLEGAAGDARKMKDLLAISQRTKNAMVDYGNMSPFERDVLSRLIFVYPWLKGSTKYTVNFVADHPIQTAMFTGLLYWQQERLKEAFPEGHPGYMKWFVPIRGGDHPYGFRLDQFATPLQTLDIAADIAYWLTPWEPPYGSNREAFVGRLNPLIEEIGKTMSGWDSFTRQEVSRHFSDLLRRMIDPRERWASWKRLKKIIDHQTHTGIYDTTQFQNWLRLFFGSIAPITMSPEEAGAYAQARQTISVPAPTQEESDRDYVQKLEEANGGPLPAGHAEEVLRWKHYESAYRRAREQLARDRKIEGSLTIQELVVSLLMAAAELNPQTRDKLLAQIPKADALSDDAATAEYERIRQQMGLDLLGTLEERVRQAQLERRTSGG